MDNLRQSHLKSKIEEKAIQLYQSGLTATKVASIVNLPWYTVYYILQKHNVARRLRGRRIAHNATPHTTQLTVLQEYKNGDSSTVIAKRHGLNVTTVLDIVRRLGGQIRDPGERNRRYVVNESAFDNHSSRAALYWAGFCLADASIKPNGNSLCIQLALSVSDKSHVRKFRGFLGSNHPIRVVPNNRGYAGGLPLASLYITSTRLATALAYYGVTPRKQTREIIPDWLINDPDYLRGLVDGDGWISTKIQCSRLYPTIGLTGSLKLCQQVAEIIRSKTGQNTTVHPNHSIWKVTTSGSYAVQIIRWLYGNGGQSLQRKQVIANKIMAADWTPRMKCWGHLTREQLVRLYHKHGTWASVASDLGINRCHLRVVRKRLGVDVG